MIKPKYPQNHWSVRVAAEKQQARKQARADNLEEAAWVGFLVLYVIGAAVVFGFKELPHGAVAVPVWVGEVVVFTVAAFAVWRFDRMGRPTEGTRPKRSMSRS